MSNRHALVNLVLSEAQVNDQIPTPYLYDMYPVEQQLENLYDTLYRIFDRIFWAGTGEDAELDTYLDVCELFKLVYPFNRMTTGAVGMPGTYWARNLSARADTWEIYEELFHGDFQDIIREDYGQHLSGSALYVFVMSLAKMFFFLKQRKATFEGYRLNAPTHLSHVAETYETERVVRIFNKIYEALVQQQPSYYRTCFA